MKKLVFFVFFYMVFLNFVSFANSFGVSPIIINLSRDKKQNSIKITNKGRNSINLQIELQDRRDPEKVVDDDIIITPKIIANFKPEAEKTVRLAIREDKIKGDKESAYRLFIRQIRPEVTPDYKIKQSGISSTLTVVLPVYVAPDQENLKLSWFVEEIDDQSGTKKFKLGLKNLGNLHGTVTRFQLFTDDDESKELTEEIVKPKTILHGEEGFWEFELKDKTLTMPEKYKLKVFVNDKYFTYKLPEVSKNLSDNSQVS